MHISFHRVKNLSYISIEDFFNPQELEEVIQETNDLRRFSLPGEKTGVAKDDKNTPKKDGNGLFLDFLYTENREASSILKCNRKIFSEEIAGSAEKFDVFFGSIKESNRDTTLLNYYTCGQQYKAHKDNARISAVTFLREGEFNGGEFIFPTQAVTIPIIHNSTVIFPSCATHQAMPIQGNGTRISIAQFIDRIEK